MASLEENYNFWNHVYDWSRYGGDEWSARWGGPDMQWKFDLYPRLAALLPAATIVEIGPGHGRWSVFLRDHCHHLILVELSETCLHACRQRMDAEESATKISYRRGDGRSLPEVEDDSVDLVFSFESLVHAELEVMADYIEEIARVLTPDGRAFLHHSNRGAYAHYFARGEVVPKPLRRLLKKAGLFDYGEWRAGSVTADKVRAEAERHGLVCRSQELINWGGRRLIDCFTVLQRRQASPQTRHNFDFTNHAFRVQRLAALYGRGVPW